MKMEQTECSETSACKIQTPGNYPEENVQHSEHGKSLKCIKLVMTYNSIKTVYLMSGLTFLSVLAAPWLMISIRTSVSHKKSNGLELPTDIRDTC